LLDAVHESLSGLSKREIVLVADELKVILLFLESDLLFTKDLGTLLERVLLQAGLSCHKSVGDFFKLLTLETDLINQTKVLHLQLLVLVTLLRVQIVEPGLVGEVDIVDLLLVRVKLILHIAFLTEQSVQVGPLLVVLVLDMHVESLDILRLRTTSILIEGQVVIGKFTFKLTNILD
jgi:hypothetical protein